MESMIHKQMPVGFAQPGMRPNTPGLEVKSHSAAVYDVYGNEPRLAFEVRLDRKVEFGKIPCLESALIKQGQGKALRCENTETDDDDDDDLPTHQWGGGCAPLSRRKASGSTNTFITGEQRSI